MVEEDLGRDSEEDGDADQDHDSRPGSPGPDAEEEEPESLGIERGATQTRYPLRERQKDRIRAVRDE